MQKNEEFIARVSKSERAASTYDGPKDDSGESTANETFPGLLGRQLNERRFAEEEAENVRHHIVDHYHRDGHDEPNQAFKHVLNDQVRLGDHNQKRDMRPGKLKQKTLP